MTNNGTAKSSFLWLSTIMEVHRLSFIFKSPSPKRTPMLQLQSSSSETDEEVIITTPRKNANDSVQFQHCVCECQNRPENNGRFVIRSRSVSPGKESTKKYQKYKPPFKVGKAPKDLISKRDFADSPARFNRSVHEDKNGMNSRIY